MTPGHIKYVKPIDSVTTWHLLQDNTENAAFYVSSLNKSEPEDFKENYWFPTPEDACPETYSEGTTESSGA